MLVSARVSVRAGRRTGRRDAIDIGKYPSMTGRGNDARPLRPRDGIAARARELAIDADSLCTDAHCAISPQLLEEREPAPRSMQLPPEPGGEKFGHGADARDGPHVVVDAEPDFTRRRLRRRLDG